MKTKNAKFAHTLAMLFIVTTAAWAQTTEFTYQGKLTVTGAQLATYQMRFELYDALENGNQVGATITNTSVAVTTGVFTVPLDFDAVAFDGAERFLQIAVRRNAADPFVTLTPRQKITSAPYAIRSSNSFNAEQLGGLAAISFLQSNGNGSNLTGVAKLNADNIFTGTDNTFPKITLSGNGEIIAPRLENAAADPARAKGANVGRIYFNTTENVVRVSDGTGWSDLSPPAPRLLQTFYANTTFSVIPCTSNIRSVTFTKTSASTRLRVTYRDSPYAAGFGSFSAAEVVVRIDGASFSPVSLSNIFRVYALGGGSFESGEEVTIVGYAEGISAGTHTLTTNYSPFSSGSPGCYRPRKYLIEIEELP